MADLLYDVKGNPIGVHPGDTPKTAEQLFDVKGNPIGGSPQTQSFIPPTVDPNAPSPRQQIFDRTKNDQTADVLPMVGGIAGGIPGAAVGSVLGSVLKYMAPKTFNKGQDMSAGDASLDALKNIAIQGVLPAAAGKLVGSGLKLLSTEGGPMAGIMASKIGRQFPAVQKGLQEAELQGFINPETSGGHNMAETMNVNRVFDAGMKNGKITNPDAILKELNSSNYDFTISPEVKQGITDFLKNVKPASEGNDHLINYSKGRLILSALPAMGGYLTGHLTSGGLTSAGAGSLVLTNYAFGKLMANPETAKLVLLATKTPATSESAPLIQKALTTALRGAEVGMSNSDGDNEPGIVGQDGVARLKKPQ